jgi:hypothetical protein
MPSSYYNRNFPHMQHRTCHPMPLVEPVMSATFPFSILRVMVQCCCGWMLHYSELGLSILNLEVANNETEQLEIRPICSQPELDTQMHT